MQNSVASPSRLIYLVISVFILLNLFVPGEKNNLVLLLSQLVVFGFAGVYLVFLSEDKKNLSTRLLFVLMSLALILSFFNSIYQYDSLRVSIQLFSMVLLAWLVSVSAPDERVQKFTMVALVVAGVFISLYGLLQIVTYFAQDVDSELITRMLPVSDHYLHQVFTQKRIFATFQLPTSLSAFIAMVLPIAGGLLVEFRKKVWCVLLLIIAMMIMVVALVQTQSNGGAIALVAGLGLGTLIILRDRKLPVAWILLGIVAAGLAAVFAIGLIRGNFIWDLAATNSPIRLRALLWQAGVAMLFRFGLTGIGAGNFHLGFFSYVGGDVRPTKYLHNSFLQIPIEFGVIGLVVMVCGLYLLARAIIVRKDKQPLSPAGYGLIISILVFLVANFFEIILYFHSLGYLGAFLIGLFLSRKNKDTSNNERLKPASPWAISGGLFCLLIMLFLGKMYLAEHLYNKASSSLTQAEIEKGISGEITTPPESEAKNNSRDWKTEIDQLQAAIALDSGNYRYHILLAQILEKSNKKQEERVLEEYKTARDLSPWLPNLHYSYGIQLIRNKQYLSGTREVATASYLYPSNKEYLEARTMLENYISKNLAGEGE